VLSVADKEGKVNVIYNGLEMVVDNKLILSQING